MIKINCDQELIKYRDIIKDRIDVCFPIDYLKQGKVYGLYNFQGEILGGFSIISQGPFRVLNSIPNFKHLEIDPKLKYTAEITGLWLKSSEDAKCASLKFWIYFIIKMLTTRKKYFVYAYSSKKSNLRKLYAKANPIQLFEGETLLQPGMKETECESVELIIKKKLLIQIFCHVRFFIKRAILGRKFKNSQRNVA